MYEIRYTSQFKKDLKLLKRRSQRTFDKLGKVIEQLEQSGIIGIDKTYKPHFLKGNYADCCECHIENDYLLIWIENSESLTIKLLRTGSHSDLF
jgi:mRNA interferase YafQ